MALALCWKEFSILFARAGFLHHPCSSCDSKSHMRKCQKLLVIKYVAIIQLNWIWSAVSGQQQKKHHQKRRTLFPKQIKGQTKFLFLNLLLRKFCIHMHQNCVLSFHSFLFFFSICIFFTLFVASNFSVIKYLKLIKSKGQAVLFFAHFLLFLLAFEWK